MSCHSSISTQMPAAGTGNGTGIDKIYIYVDVYIYTYCRSQKGCPVEMYTSIYIYIYIDHVAIIIYGSTRGWFYHARLLRVRFSVERFVVYKVDIVFGLFTMEIAISKIILPKELWRNSIAVTSPKLFTGRLTPFGIPVMWSLVLVGQLVSWLYSIMKGMS